MSAPIPLRDYLLGRPDLVPLHDELVRLLRKGEVPMVTEGSAGCDECYRVWIRSDDRRVMGPSERSLFGAMTNLTFKLAHQRVPL